MTNRVQAHLNKVPARLVYLTAGIVAGALVAGWIASEMMDRQQATVQREILVTAGWVEARVARHPERAAPDIDTTPLDTAGITTAAAAGRIVTEWVPIPVPSNNPTCPDDAPPVAPGPGGAVATVPPRPTYVSADIQFVAGLTAKADLYFDGRVLARFRTGDTISDVELPADTIDVRVSSELQSALRRGTRPRLHLVPSLRDIGTGWVVGAGLCYDSTGPAGCLFAGYAIQF